MKTIRFVTVILLLLLFGCKKEEANQKPTLNFTYALDGLTVEVNGSATDNDGQVVTLRFDWGDSMNFTLNGGDFSSISKSHHYSQPGSYTLCITATDNNGESSIQNFTLDVDFRETSLEGVKQTIFKTSDDEFLILTLNLHTYQEDNQNEKFNLIIDAIGMLDIDFVLFQECAQHKTSEVHEGIVRVDNMALIIAEGLQNKYDVQYSFIWDWAHYGWEVWEEGVAVLSKHPMADSDSRYISSSTLTTSIISRKAIYGSYTIPSIGRFNLFSAHTHWRGSLTDEEQNNQIKNIKLMVDEKEQLVADQVVISFVGGDFNGNPTSAYPWSEGYSTMVLNNVFSDTFLGIYPNANTIPPLSEYFTIWGDLPGRIDYIFMKNNPYMEVMDSQIIFTSEIIGQVSDHCGVITKVKWVDPSL